MGFVFSGMEFGVLVSPFLAGVVYQRAGYFAVFAMIFGVIGLDVVLRFFMIEKKEAYTRWAQDHRYVIDYNVVEEERDFPESDSDYAGSSEESTDMEFRSEEYPTLPTMAPDELSPLFARNIEAHGSKLAQAFGYGPRLVCLTGFAITTPAFVLLGLVKDDTIVDQVVLCLFLLLTGGFIPHSPGLQVLTPASGVGLNLILAPLAADMFHEVEILAESHPETFGNAGAYAQAYSLLCSAMGLGTALGPILAGTLFEKTGWQTTQNALAVVCLLGSVGVYLYTGRVGRGKNTARFERVSVEI